jgi:predicted permease
VAQALVVLQLAFSVLLLTAAGLGLRSLSLIDRTTLGFDTGNLLLFTVDTAGAARTADANAALVEQILGRMRAVPGLQSVSLTRHTTGRWPGAPARPSSSAAGVEAEGNAVGPDYFTTLGVPLRAGREFGDADPRGGPPRAVISRQLADALWPQADALGREFVYGAPERRLVVAGIAPDVLYGGFRRQGMPYFVFTSLGDERPEPGLTAIVARYSGSLDGILPAVRRALRDVHPGVPLLFPRTLDAELASSTWTVRALTVMVQVFAAAALLIAALGQYAAMSFSVRRRTRDFGIRVAMGASSRQIMGTALGEGLALTVAGLAIGLALGVVAGRSGRALLYGVTPADAPTHAGVVLVLGAASLAACYLPARRAARVNAVEALRDQ